MGNKIINNYAGVTLVATNDYIDGAIILYKSLQSVNSKYPLIVIVTSNITYNNLKKLQDNNIKYIRYPYISFQNIPPIEGKENIENNNYGGCTLNKFYIYTLVQYDKLMFVDADIVFYKNCDNYFNYPIPAGTCSPHTRSPGMNGGIFLIQPSIEIFIKILDIALKYNCTNDEEVLALLYKDFINLTDHIFPENEVGEENPQTMRLIHYDGPIKPGMK